MERLTKRINGVVTYIGKENSYDTGQIAAEMNTAARREILGRLADYEDTGLTPEQIRRENHTLRYLSEEYNRQLEDLVINGPPGGIEPTGLLASSLEEEK